MEGSQFTRSHIERLRLRCKKNFDRTIVNLTIENGRNIEIFGDIVILQIEDWRIEEGLKHCGIERNIGRLKD